MGEVEILSATDLFQIPNYTYSQNTADYRLWYSLTCLDKSTKKIYLDHKNDCHYEVVLCVKLRNSKMFAQFCGELFKDKIPCTTYHKHAKLQKEYKNDVEVRCANFWNFILT